jgi:hypothetical protein
MTDATIGATATPLFMLLPPKKIEIEKNGALSVAGDFFTTVSQAITIEVFANPHGGADGQTRLGALRMHAVSNTISTYSKDLPGLPAQLPQHSTLTLRATDTLGNSSRLTIPLATVVDNRAPGQQKGHIERARRQRQ